MDRKLILAGIAALCLSGKAKALPLLAESAAQNVSSNLTLYPDHQDPNKFYFMPNSSRFAYDAKGRPVFSFIYYGLSTNKPIEQSGAYMVFSMRLGSDDEQKKALYAFLISHPGAGISVLPVQSSTVSISRADDQTPLLDLFKEFNFARKAGRAEDEVAVNSLMTGIGAKVLLSAITTPAVLKVDYYYKVLGLGPNMDATVTVDFRRVYDYLHANASVQYWWFKADIDRVVETLHQQGAVTWQINGGNATDDEYVKTLAETIAKRLFVPEIAANPGAGPAGSNDWSFVRFSVGSVHKEELKTETWRVTRRDLIEREFSVPLVIKDVSDHFKDCVRDADQLPGGGGQ